MSKADSYEPLPDDRRPPMVNQQVYRSVWNEAVMLRRSGQLLKLAGQVKCPVVAIHGDYDSHPAEGVREPLSKAIHDFKFVLLEKCGHYPWLERHARDKFYRMLKVETWLRFSSAV